MVKLATTVTHSTYPTMDGQAELAWMAGEIASITQKWDILSGAGSKLSNLFIEIKIRVIKKTMQVCLRWRLNTVQACLLITAAAAAATTTTQK